MFSLGPDGGSDTSIGLVGGNEFFEGGDADDGGDEDAVGISNDVSALCPRFRVEGACVQGSEKKDAAQANFLAYSDFQAPDHGEGETEDHKIDKKIGDAIPAVKICFVDARTVRDALVPVVGDWRAFEDGSEKAGNEVAGDNAFGQGEETAEPADYAEQAVVQENEGGLEGYGGAEVEDLYG